MILIIVPIFFFQAVLIDFARIKLAERENDAAVQAAVRSVMSAFDPDLQVWGLYGLGVEQPQAEQIFSEVFQGNLSGSVTPGGFHYLDQLPAEDSQRMTPVYSLASHVIFEKQILEDMKIKAPIEFALEITDKFKKTGTAPAFQQGTQFSKEAEELEQLLEDRDEALDQAWSLMEEMHANATTYHTYYQGRITELNSLADQIGIHTADEVRSELTNVQNQLKSISDSIRNLDMSLAAMAAAGAADWRSVQSIMESRSNLQGQMRALSEQQAAWKQLLDNIVKYAALVAATKLEVPANGNVLRQLQQQMEPEIKRAKEINARIRDKLGTMTGQAGDKAESYKSFQSVAVLGDDYFYNYQTAAASITALFSAFEGIVDSVYLYTQEHTDRANQANEAYWRAADEFYAKQHAVETARMQKRDEITASKREQKNKIQQVLDQAKQSIGACTILSQSSADAELYRKLQGDSGDPSAASTGYFQKYRQANAQDPGTGNEVAYDMEKSDKVSLKAMDMLDAFNHAAAELRDELYVNEFALSKFNYRTYGLEKDESGQPKASHELTNPSTHSLQGQEAEYLIYGFSSCGANISSAYAEMFSFRLAIRTLEALLDPKKELLNVGSPLLVLLAAAAEGAAKAFIDMNQLVKGEAVELSSKIASSAIKLTYKDYLRIFLLLHSNDTKLMARMQALIELNTGKDLVQETTYMQGNAASSIRLWFVPQLMKVMEGTGLLGCTVEHNRCRMASTAVWAY
ncbi:hypothetical protein [Paenibacillus hexagrammi]|uniref:Uncharacterized protein n=1 Tax=Paenibacillus hexagrammi TaxID=2908839 RepID=A0ABY3SSJ6_9BACL|nr:hypothetical protein [Paenibacillus sp. YPD9-1]UJF35952.1 hypothetical protein L0M14_13220 [Paenibacillus sp. YPD9-1]